MIPHFKLYDSTGLSLLYTFSAVQNSNIPQSPRRTVLHEGARGKGGVIIDGGESVWDLYIIGYIFGDDYEEITDLIDAMESAVAINTPYLLRLDKDDASYYEYKVKRVEAIDYPIDPSDLRTSIQEYRLTLKVNVW